MTCNQMLERLIEADPDALAGRGTSDVAVHVRECVRCRAVANQLLAETRLLASAVERGAVVRRLRPTPIVLALAAAAALTFVVLPGQPTTPSTIGPSRAPVAATPQTVPAVVVAPALRPVVRAPASSQSAAPLAPRGQFVRAYPSAVPLTATPMQVGPTDVSYDQVAITPPPGKRAAVMRTNDPAITVVWVY